MLVEAVSLLQDMRDPVLALPLFESVANVAADTHPAESARLLAAATALRIKLKSPVLTYEGQALRELQLRLATTLGEEAQERAREAGERMTLDEAISLSQTLLETTR